MTVIARVSTTNANNNRDIIRRLMSECTAFENMTFSTAAEQFRYYERSGLVKREDGYLVIYHDCQN